MKMLVISLTLVCLIGGTSANSKVLTSQQILGMTNDSVAKLIIKKQNNDQKFFSSKAWKDALSKMSPSRQETLKQKVTALEKQASVLKRKAKAARLKKEAAESIKINLPSGSSIYPFGIRGSWSGNAIQIISNDRTIGTTDYTIKHDTKLTTKIYSDPENRKTDSIIFSISRFIRKHNITTTSPLNFSLQFRAKDGHLYTWKKAIPVNTKGTTYTINVKDCKQDKEPEKAAF